MSYVFAPLTTEMLRSLMKTYLQTGRVTNSFPQGLTGSLSNSWIPQFPRCFSAIVCQNPCSRLTDNILFKPAMLCGIPASTPLPVTSPLILQQQSRTVVKFSYSKGRRQTVKAVLAKFMRLDWGIWIRRIAGSHRKLWRKSNSRRMKLERHVMINATRSKMLDKMVTLKWRTPKYFVDDPYRPYHSREEFPLTRTKPRPLPLGVIFEKES